MSTIVPDEKMKNIKIFTKIFLSHTVIGFFSAILFSFIFYFILRDSLIQRTIDQLSSINILKRNQLDNYFLGTRKNLEFLLAHDLFLQHLDPSSSGQRRVLILNEINAIRNLYEFESIIITDSSGWPVLSTSPENLPLNAIFKKGLADANRFCIIDASTLLSSHETILLYSIPITSGGMKSGHIIVKEKFQKIQRLLQETTGMGTTGESYLVGDDFRMRSSSRFFPGKAPLDIIVKTPAVVGAFTDRPDDHVISDYRSEKVLSYYRRLGTPMMRWALISEIDFNEAMRPIIQLRNYLIVITFVIVVIIVLITLYISNAIAKPILYLRNIIITLSKGKIPEQKLQIINRDEIGQIAEAIDQLVRGIKQTTEFAYEIGSGNFNASFASLGPHDTLGIALIHMRDQLKGLNEREIRLVREKAAAVLEGQENERKRIIQELHDGVGQLLTAIRLRVEMLDSDETLRKEIMTLINDTIAEVKRISYNVMPNAIVDFGLEAALKGLCENIKKYTPLIIDFKYVKEVDRKLNFDITIAAFRIVQEGLNNIIKHAKATHVGLHILEKEEEIYMIIKDNGQGFEERQIFSKNGMGLRSMKERAKLLNGNLEIHSTPGKGTIVEMHVPIIEVNG